MADTGRPLKYKTAEELEKAIEIYFRSLVHTDTEGNVTLIESPTMAGLAYSLGFSDRRSLYHYRDRSMFFHSIKRALLKVEEGYERALFSGHASGAIFALKNMGWTDRTDLAIEAHNVNVNEQHDHQHITIEHILGEIPEGPQRDATINRIKEKLLNEGTTPGGEQI